MGTPSASFFWQAVGCEPDAWQDCVLAMLLNGHAPTGSVTIAQRRQQKVTQRLELFIP